MNFQTYFFILFFFRIAVAHDRQTIDSFSYLQQQDWQYFWPECTISQQSYQSPINIVQISQVCPEGIGVSVKFINSNTQYHLRGTRLTLAYQYSIIRVQQSSEAEIEQYQSNNIHLHNRGEHQFNGTSADIEIHINYKSTKHPTKLLILAILVYQTSDNSLLTHQSVYVSQLDVFDMDQSHLGNFDLMFRNVSQGGFYLYSGSLTTPPCLENTIWLISDFKLYVSEDTVNLWRVLINHGQPNNRAVAPLHEREVVYLNSSCTSQLGIVQKTIKYELLLVYSSMLLLLIL